MEQAANGKYSAHTHTMEHVPAKDPTTSASGNIEYWYCPGDNTYFSDAAGKNQIALADTVIPALPPEVPMNPDGTPVDPGKAPVINSSGATVPPVTVPEAIPPKTGDSATAVGFVMIALAVMAAAVVTVKIVRA